jgi:UDP-N-acetylmuramyl pentapeptide phosphotransferase/UDP-N-acetylglucosamine-1-phosphate transferase
MNILLLIISTILLLLISIKIKKTKYLKNYSGDDHQKFTTNKNIPLTGGFFIIIVFLLVLFEENNFFLISIILIFSLGLFSDLNKIVSPNKRLLLQVIIVLFLIIFTNLEINSTRVIILDRFLGNNIFNVFFVSFCVLVLINGTNFIDGLNGLSLGYYFIVTIALLNNNFYYSNLLQGNELLYLSCYLFIFLILNQSNLFFIGDSGSYSLGLIFSFLLINIYTVNSNISPFYIILLVWYPCFELLFSILRKFNINFSPAKPDIRHLHQLIYNLIKNKYNFSKLKSNNISSILILLFNSFSIILGSVDIYSSQNQIILIIMNILFYTAAYRQLVNYKNKTKN